MKTLTIILKCAVIIELILAAIYFILDFSTSRIIPDD